MVVSILHGLAWLMRLSLLSGGGDCVINIWDLEAESFTDETKVIDTLATIPQYYP